MCWLTVRVLAVQMVLLLAAPAAARQSAPPLDRSELTFGEALTLPATRGTTLRIRGVTGEIHVTRAAGPDIIISGLGDAGATEPRLELVKEANAFTICTVYTSSHPKRPNECLANGKGNLMRGLAKHPPKVQFRVQIPDGVLFAGELFMGNINANVGVSDLDLRTTHGDITIVDNGSRRIWASTEVNGKLTATISPVDWEYDRHVRLSSSMGDLIVIVPLSVPFRYKIFADSGIETPFELESTGTMRTGRWNPPRPLGDYLHLDLLTSGLTSQLYLWPREDQMHLWPTFPRPRPLPPGIRPRRDQ